MNYNPFDNPTELRQLILSTNTLPFTKIKTGGKSLACIFLTRFCSVGCPFCFYKSKPAWRKRNIEDQFDDEGIDRFINFTHEANLGYILISGGGEPMNQRAHIVQIVRYAATDRIVLVTSGHWAKNYLSAAKYLDDIYQAIKSRTQPIKVIVRISISTGHVLKIGHDPAKNLFTLFKNEYKDCPWLCLQIKTFYNDPTLNNILSEYPNVKIIPANIALESDNSILVKKIPTQNYLLFDNGYQVVVGLSKIFNSSLRPDLSCLDALSQGIDIFNEDLQASEDNNPALVFNSDGSPGIDWSINYNGDICTWQNQVRDNYMNLYEDTFEDIYKANFTDPITYSFIEKGNKYRERVVAEVNERAVLRMRAIGLRDTSGAIIFEEEKTRLYFCIRVLQDYIAEGKITEAHLSKWPEKITAAVKQERVKLIEQYHSSSFNIITQQKLKPFIQEEWLDLFRLIRLHHYDLTKDEINDGIAFYNNRVDKKITSIHDDLGTEGDIERRLTERLMHIKPLKRFQGIYMRRENTL